MKRRSLLVLVFLLLAAVPAFSQTFEWARGAQTMITASAYGIATDAEGNSVVVGSFYGLVMFDTIQINSQARDVSVAKYDSKGKLLWVQRIGSHSDDFGNAVTLDPKGNIYIAGSFTNKMGIGKDTLVSKGEHDAFVAKLSPNGEAIWARSGGGVNSDFAMGIAVDKDGNSYVAGYFRDTASFGPFTVPCWRRSLLTMFFTKYDKNGKCEWAKPIGGSNYQSQYDGLGVGTDGEGNAYLGGCIRGEAMIDSTTISCKGMSDLFLAKFSPKGKLQWAKSAGASGGVASIKAINCNKANRVTISGYFINDISFDGGKNTYSSLLGFSDLFLASYDDKGELQWVERGIGRGPKIGEALTSDAKGNLYLTGNFNDSLRFGNSWLAGDGRQALFIASFDPMGKLRFTKQSGRGGIVFSRGIGVDKQENIYVAGGYSDTAWFGRATLRAAPTTQDMFTAKIVMTADYTIKKISDEPVHENEMISCELNKKSNTLVVKFKVQHSQFVTFSFEDMLGNTTERYLDQEMINGTYELVIDIKQLVKQEYYCRLQLGSGFRQTKKINYE